MLDLVSRAGQEISVVASRSAAVLPVARRRLGVHSFSRSHGHSGFYQPVRGSTCGRILNRPVYRHHLFDGSPHHDNLGFSQRDLARGGE